MKIRRLWIVAHKEWQEIRRDRLFVGLAFVVPICITLLYGYSLSVDVEKIPLGIIDYDGSSQSRQYAGRFIQSRYFDFQGYLTSTRQVDPLLMSGRLRAVIVIPEKFQERLLAGRPAEVQTLVDGSMPTRSQMIKGYVIAINGAESMRLATDYVAQTQGTSREQAALAIQPFKLQIRYLYNQASRSVWTVAPTLMMLVLMIIPPFYTSMAVVRERESGSIFNTYSSTLTRFEFLIGKLAPYIVISFINSVLLFCLATRFFGAPFKGNLSFFFFATVVYVTCTTSIGLTVSVLARTQLAAQLITGVVTIFPTFTYAGLLKPVVSLSESDQVLAHFLPGMYYTNIIHGAFLKGLGWQHLWLNVVVIAGYSVVLISLCAAVFRKEAEPMNVLRAEFARESFIWLRGMQVMVFKEIVQLVRDIPLLLFMVYTFTGNVYLNGSAGGVDLQRARTIVHDDDHSAASRELVYRLRAPYFRLQGEVDDPAEGLKRLDTGRAMVVVDLPPKFQQSIHQGTATTVQMQIDATMTVQGFLAASYAEQIASQYALELATEKYQVPANVPRIEDDHRLWFNPNEDHRWFAPLTELVNVITVFCVLLPAAAMAREKERGTIEQLMVSPLSPSQILAPKVIAMTVVILISTALSLSLIVVPIFGVPVRGNLALFFAVSTLYIVTTTGLGIIGGTIARNMGQVGMLAMLILLPVIILSGIFTPLEGKPSWLNGLSMLVPLRHYFEITLAIFLKGAGIGVLWKDILWLLLLGSGIFVLGRWMFHRQFE